MTSTPEFSHQALVYGYDNPDILAAVAAQRFVTTLLEYQNNVLNVGKQFHVLLTGGTDTIHMFQMLRTNPLLASIDWMSVHIWWADERFVSASDEQRNALQAREGFLNYILEHHAISESHIHEMPSDDRPYHDARSHDETDMEHILELAADDYQQEIIDLLGEAPVFNLAILGMGPDGHVASLFPHYVQLEERQRIVVGVTDAPKEPPVRLTLTLPSLSRVERAWFLTSGSAKGNAFMHVIAEEDTPSYPASYVCGTLETAWLTTSETLAAAIR